MRTINPFRQEVNHLCNGLIAQGNITIHYTNHESLEPGNRETAFTVTGVNGIKTPEIFKITLRNLQVKFRKRLNDLLLDTAPGSRVQVVRLTLEQTRRLLEVTSTTALSQMAGAVANEMKGSRIFSAPRFISSDRSDPGELMQLLLLRHTAPYAQAWHRTLKELHHELFSLQCILSYGSLLVLPDQPKTPDEKIPVNSSTRIMAAFGRMLYDFRVIGIRNKSQVCRLIAEKFETPRQKNISAEKLRQHFESPDPEIVKLICESMIKWMQKYMKTEFYMN